MADNTRFTQIPQDAFQELQINAGILLTDFDPETAEFDNENIVCATTGGITASCVATYSDYASDVDNAPNDLKEFKHLDGWQSTLATTGLGTSPELIRMALGAADIDENNPKKVTPRRYLKDSDFRDLWFVGDRADGGMVAVKLINALSTGGFVLKTTKNGKGQVSLTLTGHVSIKDQNKMPMEFYSADPPEDEEAPVYDYTAVVPVGTENPAEEGWYVLVGDNYRLTTDAEVDSNVTYYERSVVTPSNP